MKVVGIFAASIFFGFNFFSFPLLGFVRAFLLFENLGELFIPYFYSGEVEERQESGKGVGGKEMQRLGVVIMKAMIN